MQEHLLSKRCLFFFEKEMYFQSKEFSARESIEIHLPSESHRNSPEQFASMEERTGSKRGIVQNSTTLLDHLQSAENMDFDIYKEVVSRYTGLNLTHLGDRLSAFQGVLSVIESTHNMPDELQTLSGFPTQYFSHALRWESSDPAHRISMDTLKSRRLPSWSWVGWTGHIQIPADYMPNEEPKATGAIVMDAANILLDLPSRSKKNPTPRPAITYHGTVETPLTVILHIRGPMARCTPHQSFTGRGNLTHYGLTLHGPGDVTSVIDIAFWRPVGQALIMDHTTFRLVQLGTDVLLLLSISDGIAERVALVTKEYMTDPDGSFPPEILDCFEDAYLPVR